MKNSQKRIIIIMMIIMIIIIKGTERVENQRTNRDHPDYSIDKIFPNTEKRPGDMKRLAVTKIEIDKHIIKIPGNLSLYEIQKKKNAFCEIVYLLRSRVSTLLINKTQKDSLVWFVGFYGISTFVGYLSPNPFLSK